MMRAAEKVVSAREVELAAPDPLTGFHDLPLPFTKWDWAYAVNDGGVIVGMIQGRNSQPFYAVVSWSGIFSADLNILVQPNSGWYLGEALGINSSGSIVGYGFSPNHRSGAWVAVPSLVSKTPLVNIAADIMKILSGVVADSGGSVLPFGVAKPIPVPPPRGPEFQGLPQPFRAASAARAFRQSASQISRARLRPRIKSIRRGSRRRQRD